MAGESPREPKPTQARKPTDISGQATLREETEPSNQIILGASAMITEGHATHKTGARLGMPTRIGQYHVVRELGRGGMGVVYLARQPSLNREVALKVLNINMESDPEDAARFRSEAKLAASLQHPNIVQIYEIGEQDGFAFIAMEYVAGGSLHQYLKDYKPTPREAAELLEPIARAMHHAHTRGVIHRDLKPGNILLSAGSESRPAQKVADDKTVKTNAAGVPNEVPKITDFGLAKNLNQSMQLTATGVALGTPSYMSPEQARDDRRHIGPCSDVYAIGAILYEMLTNKPPFSGSSPLVTMQQVVRTRPVPPSQLQTAVPSNLESICLKCLEKLPKNRYANAEELANALRRYLDAPTEAPRRQKRSRWPYYALAATLLIAAAASWIAISQYQRAKDLEATAARNRNSNQNGGSKTDSTQLNEQQAHRAIQMAPIHGERGQPDRAVVELTSAIEANGNNASPDLLRVLRTNVAEWNRHLVRPVKNFTHAPRIHAMAWSPDGKLLAVAGDDGHVRFFSRDGNEVGKSVECQHGTLGGRRPAISLGWSPKGDRLAVGGYVGHIYLFDPATREAVGEPIKPEGHAREVWQTLITRDGKTLIVASAEGSILTFDLASREFRSELTPREVAGSRIAMALSPDDMLLATGGKSGILRVSELKVGKSNEYRNWKLGGEITALAFSPDGRCLVAGTQSGGLFLWNRLTDRLIDLPSQASAIRAIAFSHDGRTFAISTDGGTLCLWDADSRQPLMQPMQFDQPIQSLEFHPGDGTLAFGDGCGNIRFIEIPPAQQVRPALQLKPGPESAVSGLGYSKDGGTLLTVSYAHPALWTGAGVLQAELDQLHTLVGAIHADGSRVALGGRGGRLQMIETKEKRNLLAFTDSPLKGDARVVRFSLDGTLLLTAAYAETTAPRGENPHSVWIWTVADPKKRRQILETLTSPIQCAAWHPDGKRIVVGSSDGKVSVWNIEKNEQAGVAFDLGSPVQCVAISPDGKRLAAGGSNGTGMIWSLENLTEPAKSLQHQERITAIAFSPDSRWILTGSHDKTSRYWDAPTGWPIGPTMRHPEAVLSVTFEPQGKYALSGCKDGAVRFWRVP